PLSELGRVLELRANLDYEGARREALRAPEGFEVLLELGRLHQDFGDYDEAETTFERAASVASEDSLRSRALAMLAYVYLDQARFEEARTAAQEALTFAGEDSLAEAGALVERSYVQLAIGEYAPAEDAFRRALTLTEHAVPGLELDRIRTRARAGLGTAFRAQGRYADAEPVFREVIELCEDAFGPDSLETLNALNDLGILFKYAGRFDEAEPLYRRALEINRRAVGEIHYNAASLYHNLGGLEHARGNYAEAEPHARRSVEIRRATVGPEHPSTAADEAALASILYALR